MIKIMKNTKNNHELTTIYGTNVLMRENNLNIEQILNRSVLAYARSFFNAAQCLKNGDFLNNTIPLVVNTAFALELYLKSFNSDKIFINGKNLQHDVVVYENIINEVKKTGHNLLDLYQCLSDDIKDLIKKEYKITNISFEDAISEYKNIFTDWRYGFEGNINSINLTDITVLLTTLDNVASKLEQ